MAATRGHRSPDRLPGLLEEAQRLGFLGPGPVEAHLEHARAMAEAVEAVSGAVAVGGVDDGGTGAGNAPRFGFLDLGSGGGVPGLYLASRWSVAGALLDSNRRRCEFLRGALRALELGDRVVVIEARAEVAAREAPWRGGFAVVVARSFAGPAATAECAVGFLDLGGVLLVSDPPTDADGRGDASRWDAEGLAVLGLERERSPAVGRAVAAFRKVADSDRYPRRTGVPAKRPLWA